MSRIDRLALLLCLCALIANAWVAAHVFENIPHLEDEYTYIWEAQAITRGQFLVPSPPSPQSFLVPFVIDYNGWRFGKYPLGFPVLLSFGILLGARDWVNPLIAAWSLWLIYRLGKKLLGERTALLAIFLTAISPFYLINSANLLPHAWSLFLSLSLALAWLDLFFFPSRLPAWMLVAVAGLSLGALALTRPWTAIGVALPFALHGAYLLLKNRPEVRRRVIGVGLIGAGVACAHFLWQAALTGSPWINPYTLWWPFDRLGFGPGIGVTPGGNTPLQSLNESLFSLRITADDLAGWPYLSWLFIPLGVVAIRKNRPAKLVSLVFPGLVLVYLFYWVGAWIYGPRYYYEGLYSLTLLSAAGMVWLMGKFPLPRFSIAQLRSIAQRIRLRTGWVGQPTRKKAARSLISIWILILIVTLIAADIFYYIPMRVGGLTHLYGAERALMAPFLTPAALARTPALVIVQGDTNWRQYATLLELSSPYQDTPFIFAISQDDKTDRTLANDFPDRQVYIYNPQQPGQFGLVKRSK